MIEETIRRVLMDRFQVIYFEEHIEQHFDSAGHVIAARMDQHEVIEFELPKLVRQRAQAFEQRGRIGIFIDEYPAAKRFAAHRQQRPAGKVEIDKITLVAHRFQLAIERIAPAVIAADKAAALSGLRRDKRAAAMATRVVEGAQAALQIAHDQNWRAGIADQEPVARFGDLTVMAGIKPASLPQAVLFQFQKLRIDIAGRRDVGQPWKAGRGFCARRFERDGVLDPPGRGRVHSRWPSRVLSVKLIECG